MPKCDLIVVGGGPAGMAAAIAAAEQGLSVELIEQRRALGGAFFRQPAEGADPIPKPASFKARWHRLSSPFSRTPIKIRYGCIFLGVDSDGLVLVDDRQAGEVLHLDARAVIIATGACEKVRALPGWDTPGVSTVGGLQVMMKETGRPANGRILLAGNGPLLIAAAAQMARAGNPPVAIIEAGDPLRPGLAGLGLLLAPHLLTEAFGYLGTVYKTRIPWLRRARIEKIETQADGLQATVILGSGDRSTFLVDRIGLHDGFRPNDMGLPVDADGRTSSPVVIRAGDCCEVLGCVAAEADGAFAAHKVMALLGLGRSPDKENRIPLRLRLVQVSLARLFVPIAAPIDVPDHTVLCRCEGRTVGDLKRLLAGSDAKSGREVKLNGRFAMGECQGRFCAANVAELMTKLRPEAAPIVDGDLTGQRWPLRPVPIAAFIAGTRSKTSKS
jgi:NADPH-dependent 2,4-dienoyl-CoA reductase/sulfur reductase-like enzyme